MEQAEDFSERSIASKTCSRVYRYGSAQIMKEIIVCATTTDHAAIAIMD
jgi:hypothetical protein